MQEPIKLIEIRSTVPVSTRGKTQSTWNTDHENRITELLELWFVPDLRSVAFTYSDHGTRLIPLDNIAQMTPDHGEWKRLGFPGGKAPVIAEPDPEPIPEPEYAPELERKPEPFYRDLESPEHGPTPAPEFEAVTPKREITPAKIQNHRIRKSRKGGN